MADDNLKSIKKIVEEAIKPIVKRLDDPKTGLSAINQRLNGVETQLNNPKTGLVQINKKLDTVWEQTSYLTEEMAEVQQTLEKHTDILKSNSVSLGVIEEKVKSSNNNTKIMNKRVSIVEDRLGIVPPPELTIME